MINLDDFTFMGFRFFACDTGITADSAKELFYKVHWCHSVGIYTDKLPLQSHTIANVIMYNLPINI